MIKYFCSPVFFLLLVTTASAQVPYNSAVPNGYTKKAAVSEQVGITEVSISYHRPAVNGRDGKIWGQVVHTGFVNQGFGNGKPAPWRAGANETTTISFDKDVKVEGMPLSKGKYGLFIAYDTAESIVIFSKKHEGWGSFFYEEKEDVLRVKVKPVILDRSVEHLQYAFTAQSANAAVIALSWEKRSIPFKVEVDLLRQQLEAFDAEAQNPRGFTAQGLNIAASWALQNNYGLEKALEWANTATRNSFPGDPTSFPALSTKSLILEKLGRREEGVAVVRAALSFGNSSQLQQYGRQLIAAKDPDAALEVFEYSYKKNGDQFIVLTGMARGLSAKGDYAKALEFANKALPLAPNDAGRQAVQAMIGKLKEGKDIN
jgi:tetratricopeptide (TPR) repeat protein